MNDGQIEPNVKRTPKTEAERLLSKLERYYFPEMYKDVIGAVGTPLSAKQKKRILSMVSDFYDHHQIPPRFSLAKALFHTDKSSEISSSQMSRAAQNLLGDSSAMPTLAASAERAWDDAGKQLATIPTTELHRTLSDAIVRCLEAYAAQNTGDLHGAWAAVVDAQATVSRVEAESSNKRQRLKNAKAGAEALHNRHDGTRKKRREIREIWADGKYSSRDICAEQECAALGMSFSTARKALQNTPDP